MNFKLFAVFIAVFLMAVLSTASVIPEEQPIEVDQTGKRDQFHNQLEPVAISGRTPIIGVKWN